MAAAQRASCWQGLSNEACSCFPAMLRSPASRAKRRQVIPKEDQSQQTPRPLPKEEYIKCVSTEEELRELLLGDALHPTLQNAWEHQSVPEEAKMTTLIDEVAVPGLDIGGEIQNLFCDDWSRGTLVTDMIRTNAALSIVAGPLIQNTRTSPEGSVGSSQCAVRHVSCVCPVKYKVPMVCPPTTRMASSTRMSTEGESDGQSSLLIEAAFVVYDIPFADAFVVRDQTLFRPCPGGALVTRKYIVHFQKFCPVAAFLRTCIGIEQQTLADDLLRLFHNRARGSLIQSSALTCQVTSSEPRQCAASKESTISVSGKKPVAANKAAWGLTTALALSARQRVDITKSWIFFMCVVLTFVVALASPRD